MCDLFLGVHSVDEIHHDDLILEISSKDRTTEWRRWQVGVNYFSSQADGRWWRDHRFPGGMAFSMNSVGHMARMKAELLLAKDPTRIPKDVPSDRLVDWALPTAMKTIGPPSAETQRGTWLKKHGTCPEDSCRPVFDKPIRNFEELAGFSENRYAGRYHTDITIPSEYFREELWKLEEIGSRSDLFFTYLHSLTDPDYQAMGIGNLFESDENDKRTEQF